MTIQKKLVTFLLFVALIFVAILLVYKPAKATPPRIGDDTDVNSFLPILQRPPNTPTVAPTSTALPTATIIPTQTSAPPTNTPRPDPQNCVPAPANCSCGGNIYNCGDFTYQCEAQHCYDYCVAQGAGDIHRLDRDNDGVVCESLPFDGLNMAGEMSVEVE